MSELRKVHEIKQAAEGHLENIKKNGGKGEILTHKSYGKTTYIVVYSYPEKDKKEPFFDSNQRQWDSARISSGTYNTKGYFSKEYSTKSGLEKGLKSYGYKSIHPYSGETWNVGGKQYKITFDYK